jgi:folate-binding protein YgfZ
MNDIATQYRIIAAEAGWIEKSVRGRLQFDGADRVSFLQALVTNDIAGLKPGEGAYSAYLTPQGRMITDLHLFIREHSVLAGVPAEAASSLVETFDRLIFTEDVRVSNQSAMRRQFSVIGGRAPEMLARALAVSAEALRALPLWSQIDTGDGFIVRTDDAGDRSPGSSDQGLGSWDVILPAEAVDTVIPVLESAGVVPASRELIDALRIDAGRPMFGIDMTTETIPLEAGLLDRAISQTKGCYVGQEVIIRVLHRGAGRVAKRLVQLTAAAAASIPATGSRITVDGREIGAITSAGWSPRSERAIALGYVSRDHAEPGRVVSIDDSGAATITKLAS